MINDILNLLIERRAFFTNLLLEHLKISIISILIAIVLGLIIGIMISEYKRTSRLTLGTINFIYTIPSISLLGFLIPFSGIGNITAVIALSVYALLPMVRNTYTGITNIDENILEAAKGMGSTNMQILFKIKLPLAMPVIMSGIRNMVTMTIALAGIASFIGAGGLGVAIYRGITTNNAAMTLTGSLLIAVLALIIDALIGAAGRRIKARRKYSNKNKVIAAVIAVVLCIGTIGGTLWSSRTRNTINIATKPMTEQYIIGEMLDMLIEQETDLNVELTHGVGGGTSNIQPAMEKGEFDIYPEYTGTGWNMVLKKSGLYDEEMFNSLQDQYQSDFNMSWVGMYGFNNTYGLVVRSEIADQYDIKTYSDLARISDQLVFGAEYDFFEREDGYDPLCSEYGFKFKDTVDLDIGLKYQAINQKKIDVMNIFTTDGQLSVSDVTVLIDDKGFYPSYMCGNVIRNEVLEAHPELEYIFVQLEGAISDENMAEMNYQVETDAMEPRDVAEAFLKAAGLLE